MFKIHHKYFNELIFYFIDKNIVKLYKYYLDFSVNFFIQMFLNIIMKKVLLLEIIVNSLFITLFNHIL